MFGPTSRQWLLTVCESEFFFYCFIFAGFPDWFTRVHSILVQLVWVWTSWKLKGFGCVWFTLHLSDPLRKDNRCCANWKQSEFGALPPPNELTETPPPTDRISTKGPSAQSLFFNSKLSPSHLLFIFMQFASSHLNIVPYIAIYCHHGVRVLRSFNHIVLNTAFEPGFSLGLRRTYSKNCIRCGPPIFAWVPAKISNKGNCNNKERLP